MAAGALERLTLYFGRRVLATSRSSHNAAAPSARRGVGRLIRSPSIPNKLLCATALIDGHLRHASSDGNACSEFVAPGVAVTIASGLGARTASVEMVGTSGLRSVNTLWQPHKSITSLMMCVPLSVISGSSQT